MLEFSFNFLNKRQFAHIVYKNSSIIYLHQQQRSNFFVECLFSFDVGSNCWCMLYISGFPCHYIRPSLSKNYAGGCTTWLFMWANRQQQWWNRNGINCCMSATAAKAKEVDYVTVIMFTPKTGATLYNIIHAAASQFTFFYITISSFANLGEK